MLVLAEVVLLPRRGESGVHIGGTDESELKKCTSREIREYMKREWEESQESFQRYQRKNMKKKDKMKRKRRQTAEVEDADVPTAEGAKKATIKRSNSRISAATTERETCLSESLHCYPLDTDIELGIQISDDSGNAESKKNDDEQDSTPQRQRSFLYDIIILLLVCGMATVILLMIYNVIRVGPKGSNDDDADLASPTLPPLLNQTDPWTGITVNSTSWQQGMTWPNVRAQSNNGQPYTEDNDSTNYYSGMVEIDIVNALDESWQPYFAPAVYNWEHGDPVDPLTLNVETAPHDPTCTPIKGKLKVCNANYGPNQWRGKNDLVVSLPDHKIVSSTARMNEYYLQEEGPSRKLYTLCHEVRPTLQGHPLLNMFFNL